ncbi:putative membrane protein [Rhodotorula toruloides ATCC 204091]|uniref:Ribosome biogenesis protein NOP53 n=1 Tax=Rhodotorula toruloides TaxID=5286 RepID=A0A0K3CAE7_RHOTO|nr:putative membrane protein [Rhodotorula toruloides ATCC 204091]PRQ77107.1 putative membrane protein [Rhodotorula toruloides]
MPKARANSKKAAPSTAKLAASADADKPLFEIDTTGSSSVRHALLADQAPAAARLRKGQSFKKPLRSELILAQRSNVPALSSKVVPSAEAQAKRVKAKLGKVDRATKEKLKRMTGRDGQGEGLWGLKSTGNREEAVSGAVRDAGKYDAWKAEQEAKGEDEDAAMKEVLAIHDPKTRPAPKPRSVAIPHPGMSYNPAHDHHQALLASALVRYEAEEERDERGQDAKEALDEMRRLARGREAWEVYEEEVGSGEEDEELAIVDPEAQAYKELLKRRAAKRKTKAQRNTKLRVTAEMRDLADRRAMKKRIASVQHAKDVQAEILAAKNLSLEEKAAALKARKARLAERGLARYRSGPSRVPAAPVTFQLGDELAENLRTLQPEGNLWKEWVNSGMRRGKVPVERANESKKGGKRGGRGHDKGHGMREFEKHAFKRFDSLS